MSETEEAIKERPILFNGAMVRAILAGRKTQTRRVIDSKRVLDAAQKKIGFEFSMEHARASNFVAELERLGVIKPAAAPFRSMQLSVPIRHPDDARTPWQDCGYHRMYCPLGAPGDRLWVRETHLIRGAGTDCGYRADMSDFDAVGIGAMYGGWKPSIFMPRWASRITLEITGVRVERVRQISGGDAIAEGIIPLFSASDTPEMRAATAVAAYSNLWDSINKKRGFGWDVNPWVWVIEFKRVTA